MLKVVEARDAAQQETPLTLDASARKMLITALEAEVLPVLYLRGPLAACRAR